MDNIRMKTLGVAALLGDGQNVLTHAIKYMGHSLNSTDPAHIKAAEEMLIAQKPHIKVFADDNGQDLLASGEVDLTQEWNGDLLQVMEEDDDIGLAAQTLRTIDDQLGVALDVPDQQVELGQRDVRQGLQLPDRAKAQA